MTRFEKLAIRYEKDNEFKEDLTRWEESAGVFIYKDITTQKHFMHFVISKLDLLLDGYGVYFLTDTGDIEVIQ